MTILTFPSITTAQITSLCNILKRHGFSHQFPSNVNGKFLSIDVKGKTFHWETKGECKASDSFKNMESAVRELIKKKEK